MHGTGTYKWVDGRLFVGSYKENLKDGHGMYLWSDGSTYNGNWQNGKQHGSGYYIEKDKDNSEQLKIRKGIWEEGKRKCW